MANKTVYPYGTGGTLPASIGIINDLTTGGVNKALSAEQGKVLGGKISQMDDKVNDLTMEIGGSISVNTTSSGWKLLGNGRCASDSSARLRKYRVTAGKTIYLKLSADTPGVYQFQSADSVHSSGTNENLIGSPVNVATDDFVVVPSGATYLIVSELTTNSTNEVKEVTVYSFQEIGEEVEQLNEDMSSVKEGMMLFDYVDISSFTEETAIISSAGKWQLSGGKCRLVPITPGVSYKVIAQNSQEAGIAVLAESSVGEGGASVAFATGFSSRITISAGQSYEFTAPSNAQSLYVRTKSLSNVNITPTVYKQSDQSLAQIVEQLRSATDQSLNTLVGEGDNLVSKRIQLVTGLKYTIWLADSNVSMDGVSSENERFAIDAYNSSNTRISRLVVVNTGQSLEGSYVITIPSNCAYVTVGVRCAVGAQFRFVLTEGWMNTNKILIGTFNSSYNETDTYDVRNRFSELMLGKQDIETFLFFTDPHLTPNSRYETMTELVRDRFISILQKYYNSLPMDTCICGGDWLNDNHTNKEASGWLGYCDAYMRKLFRNYLPVFGNHDSNPYNPNTDAYNWLKALTYGDINNLMFRENGNSYYSYKAVKTQFYVLNSGVSFIKTMTNSTYSRLVDNRWPQVDWFGNKLLSEDPEHGVIIMHLYANASNEEEWFSTATGYWARGYHEFGWNIRKMAIAYNKRESITLNGITYDFSSCNGHIAFLMCGHTHFDYVDTSDELPIVCVTNLEGGYVNGNTVSYSLKPSFDNCLVDYDNGCLYLIRVGVSKSRYVHFIPKTLAVGGTLSLTSNLTGTITWTSRDTSKATVSSGTVTGAAQGIVGIVASTDTTDEYWIINVS